MPLVCCTNTDVTAFCSAGLLALTAAVKVLCCTRGEANCLNELRRARLACLEAMVSVSKVAESWKGFKAKVCYCWSDSEGQKRIQFFSPVKLRSLDPLRFRGSRDRQGTRQLYFDLRPLHHIEPMVTTRINSPSDYSNRRLVSGISIQQRIRRMRRHEYVMFQD
jgi:hypothetical protein